MIRPFFIALQLLTRLPMRLGGGDLDEREVGRSILFYPLVGLMLGLLLATLAWLLEGIAVFLRASLLLAVWVGITGALHLDGLADCVDAWVGGHGDRERTLAIMRDPCSGPMGVAAIVLTLMVKLGALVPLCEAGDMLALVVVPVLGRTVLPLLFLTTPYVRPGGLGAALAAYLPRRTTMWVMAATILGVSLAGGVNGMLLILISACAFLLLRTAARRRLGGTTGDFAGAMVELTEAAVLTAAAIIATFPQPA